MYRNHRQHRTGRYPRGVLLVGIVGASLVITAVPEQPASTSPQAISLPGRLQSDTNPDQYLWIATSEMFDSTGAMLGDPTLFPSHWRSGLADALRKRHEDQRAGSTPVSCIKLLVFVDHARVAARRFSDLDTLVAQSSGLVRGMVVNSAGGFLDGSPGVMLEVAVKDTRFRGTGRLGQQTTYVFFPGGEVPFGVTSLCPRLSAHWPPVPGIGAEVMVVLDRDQRSVHQTIPIYSLDTRGHELIYEQNGRMFTSSQLWALDGIRGVRSLDALFTAATRAFAGGNQ